MIGGVAHKHFLMAAIWTFCMAKTRAMDTSKSLWNMLCQSFSEMLRREGASTGGFFGIVVFTTGDLEYFNSFHQLPHWTANRPCSLCSIDKADLGNWKNTQPTKPDDWQLPRSHPCPLFRELLSPCSVCPDMMHSKHLGKDLRFLGSVTWLLIFEKGNVALSISDRLFHLQGLEGDLPPFQSFYFQQGPLIFGETAFLVSCHLSGSVRPFRETVLTFRETLVM